MTPPNATQLEILQKPGLRTRLDSSPHPRPPKRICAEEGCETKLSLYNEGDTCSIHRGWPTSPMTSFEHRESFAEFMDERYEAIGGETS